MTEALLLVHNTLVGTNLREHIAIGAAGKITSAFNIARTLALGADWCNAARGYMFSLGCIQALSCHTGKCPSGVATQDPRRSKKLDVQDKSQRVYNYHKNTLEALMNLLEASGLKHPPNLGRNTSSAAPPRRKPIPIWTCFLFWSRVPFWKERPVKECLIPTGRTLPRTASIRRSLFVSFEKPNCDRNARRIRRLDVYFYPRLV